MQKFFKFTIYSILLLLRSSNIVRPWIWRFTNGSRSCKKAVKIKIIKTQLTEWKVCLERNDNDLQRQHFDEAPRICSEKKVFTQIFTVHFIKILAHKCCIRIFYAWFRESEANRVDWGIVFTDGPVHHIRARKLLI